MPSVSQRSQRVAETARVCLHKRLTAVAATPSCEFRDGVLTLRGRATSYYNKQVAQEAVRELDGVAIVVNEIEVITQAT